MATMLLDRLRLSCWHFGLKYPVTHTCRFSQGGRLELCIIYQVTNKGEEPVYSNKQRQETNLWRSTRDYT
jgi:hypothetical protein